MPRRLRVPAIIVAACGAVVFLLLPPAARHAAAPPQSVVRGAFHVHSNRSDGSGTVDEIAAAASRAGLQFVILTDHGDGTRPVDAPSYRHGVLTIDGVEINTAGGHYAVVGLPQTPYPLAGDPDAVIEDVQRFGGFGFAAHPGSPRPSLAWNGWTAPIEGLEWINGDSEWRDEDRLPIARSLVTYLFRPAPSVAALLDRPAPVLERWDALSQTRPVPVIAGLDAHARLGFQQRTDPDTSWLHLPLPGYEALFRTFSNHVVLDAPLSGQAAADADRLAGAIRGGRLYSVIDAIATPGALSFTATSGSRRAGVGESLAADGDVLLHAAASAPPGTTLVLLRNGQRIHEVTDGALDTNGGREHGVYRIEAYVAGRAMPWIVSNPIYVGIDAPASAGVPAVQSRIPARTAEAATEAGAHDTSRLAIGEPADARARTFAGDPGIDWSFGLGPGSAAGQFAAVPIPISPGLDGFERVRFTVSAAAPMRAWVQLRAGTGNADRWGATFYADATARTVDIPFAKFHPIGTASGAQPPLDRVTFLMFVVDTLNTAPGTQGRLAITDVAFVK